MDKKVSTRKEKEQAKTHSEEYVKELRKKMKVLDQRKRELRAAIRSVHDGIYDDQVREGIMDLLCMNVGRNKVNDVIRTVLQKLAKKRYQPTAFKSC